MNKTCDNCHYFETYEYEIWASPSPNPSSAGSKAVCHRYPEQIEIRGNYWCGEWQPGGVSDEMENVIVEPEAMKDE